MDIRTNLLEEYVNFVDNMKKRITKLWICTNTVYTYIHRSILVF